MPTILRHPATPQNPASFFTVVTFRRQPILCDAPVRAALRDGIATVRASRPFAIHAWVLLPDHLHCLWTLSDGDADYATRWAVIKRHVSLACTAYRRDDWANESRRKHRESTGLHAHPTGSHPDHAENIDNVNT